MSTYEQLKGLKVKYLSADTSGDREVKGQLYYNSADFKLKSHLAVAAWSSSSHLINDKVANGNVGIQTAALSCGGFTSVPDGNPDRKVTTEAYSGVVWTAAANMNTAKSSGVTYGTQTAALAAQGESVNSEEYNGTSWTEGNNLGAVKYYTNRTGCGTQTAGLCAGGYDASAGSPTSNVQEYDGTSWSEVNNAPAVLLRIAGCGVQTAAILTGNQTNPKSTIYLYDGTNWTTSPNASPSTNSTTFAGTQAGGILAGGAPVPYNGTLSHRWDGTSFSVSANLAIAREAASASSTSLSSNFVCGGNNPGAVQDTTEEYSDGVVISSVAKSIDFD